MMARKSMTRDEFNKVMKRCAEIHQVRYVSPVIHPRIKEVTAFTIWTADDEVAFTIKNNPDVNFNLYEAVNDYLDKLLNLVRR